MPSFVTHLESAIDGTILPARQIQTLHQGRPLWVRYDLPAIASAVSPADIAPRPATIWRYHELLPVDDDDAIVCLGEGSTSIIECPRLAAHFGIDRLLIKDESQLPTGSFKSRGMAVAVSMAKQFGIKRVAAPTAGNAGGALAAYAARAGMECFLFMPDDTPIVNQYEAAVLGAKVFLVNGLINDCGKIVADGASRMGWFDMSTLKEPYRIEGKKTMGIELAEQFGWSLPDVILYPTGGGTGLIGMWKAFEELETLGWLRDDGVPRVSGSSAGPCSGVKKPRMFACQASGCAPIPTAFDKGERFAAIPENPHTIASGLRVPKAVGDFMILDAVRASGGRAMACPEDQIIPWMRRAASLEGISLCPESAACLGVLERALLEGHIRKDETVVLFNTGAVQKYVEAMRADLPCLDKAAVDWSRISA